MKSKIFNLVLALISINSYSQKTFNWSDFDYYNKDTNLVVQYRIIYDSIAKSEIKVVKKIVDDIASIKDKSLVDTISTPRYMIHFSDEDTKQLEDLILCSLDWLLTNKIDSDEETWNKVEKFVLSSNSVSTPINDRIIEKL